MSDPVAQVVDSRNDSQGVIAVPALPIDARLFATAWKRLIEDSPPEDFVVASDTSRLPARMVPLVEQSTPESKRTLGDKLSRRFRAADSAPGSIQSRRRPVVERNLSICVPFSTPFAFELSTHGIAQGHLQYRQICEEPYGHCAIPQVQFASEPGIARRSGQVGAHSRRGDRSVESCNLSERQLRWILHLI